MKSDRNLGSPRIGTTEILLSNFVASPAATPADSGPAAETQPSNDSQNLRIHPTHFGHVSHKNTSKGRTDDHDIVGCLASLNENIDARKGLESTRIFKH